MDMSFDKQLNTITTYQIHPSFLPYIGDDFDEYRVLHVGESHYIGQSPENERFGIDYFQKWWSAHCEEVEGEFGGWFTRPVMQNYMDNKQGAYTIFNNFLKSFSRSVLDKEISINPDTKKLYRYLAFMNFFQMPSLYDGVKYWDSLEISAKKHGNMQAAYDMWDAAVKNATETLDAVIDIIKPKAVVITSISAGNAYKKCGGKNVNSIVFTSHPAYPYTWYKELKALDGQRGVDVCEQGLRKVFRT